jgi:pimeloyl-ACP methyl ester carboxylesterase
MDRRQASRGIAALLAGASLTTQGARAQPGVGGGFGGFPYAWAPFSKEGALIGAAPALLQDSTVTDFVILCHGWQTDQPHAVSSLYDPLLASVADCWARNDPRPPTGRKYAALLVLWPSKQFGVASSDATVSNRGRARATDVSEDWLHRRIDDFAAFTSVDATLLHARAHAIVRGGIQQADCAALMEAARSALGAANDAELAADTARYDPATAQAMFLTLSGERRFRFAPDIARRQDFDRVQRPVYRGAGAAICSVLNTFTYYTMKARAGVVGRGLAEQILAPLQREPAQRIHLIGHSFGARVATAAAYHAGNGSKLRSLTMLQGAFSQNALSVGGAFAGAHRNIAGPVLITHTHNDEAVSRYYAIASHASGDTSRTLGDAQDAFGAIGANGAQGVADDLQTPAPICTRPPDVFQSGKVHNMNCDACITNPNAHMNVTNSSISRIVATILGA